MASAITIAIVDDDEDVRQSLRHYLRSAGIEAQTFASAEEFLGSPGRASTDCLITDLHMTGMDGLALQEELNSRGRSFPVIVMTGYPTPDAEAASMALGATVVLAKPIDPDALLDRVEKLFA